MNAVTISLSVVYGLLMNLNFAYAYNGRFLNNKRPLCRNYKITSFIRVIHNFITIDVLVAYKAKYLDH